MYTIHKRVASVFLYYTFFFKNYTRKLFAIYYAKEQPGKHPYG